MRRVLLGGLGFALGVFARPAAAQDFRPANSPDPVQRAARLGRPTVAAPAPAADPGVTPVGAVLARGQMTAPGAPAPMPVPMQMAPAGGTPKAGGQPSVTVSRDQLPTNGLGAAANPTTPAVVPGAPVVVGPGGVPMVVGQEYVVSPGAPADCPAGGCPTPTLDAPLAGGAPRFPALGRLFGLGCDRTWVSTEYLLWWTRSTQVPPLAATGVIDPTGAAGITGQQNLLSGSFGQTLHGGVRVGAGHWFSDEQRRGVDARLFYLFRSGETFTANSGQYPTLFLPFNNVNTPVGPTGNIVAAPGIAQGGIAVTLENSMWGADVNYRRFLTGNACFRLDGLVGYRYLNFTETLSITETAALLPTAPFSAPGGVINDRFRAVNNFHGGQVGLTGEVRRGRWFVDGRATVALGSVQQTAEIAGGQARFLANGTTGLYGGGLYALPGANAGTFNQNKFAVLPEVGVNLGYHITPGFRVFVGYNFLYLSSVLRPANMIDPNIDAARVPNFPLPGSPAPLAFPRPVPQMTTTDFFAQGINFGLQWTW
ncbi:BBP7 family outer membrane beta-barrel protein [bacterium]|nr:BBP7 family outer membrane beta-barrel protein [bacterium]